jgi:TPP-dependent trihydroxycyclohexane-1,2-dione (THcHDO) dehydratase
MATAYARQARRLRALAVTTSIGPGATNLVTGAAMATVNRIPVLLLPGDLFATRRVTPSSSSSSARTARTRASTTRSGRYRATGTASPVPSSW